MASVQYSSIITNQQQQQHHHQQDELVKPTIFDILAQENLLDLFHSSFNHVFNWLSNYNQTVAKLEAYNDEIYLLLHSSIEYIYLKTRNALFSEYFYGLKRSRKLGPKLKLLSIASSIVIPYVKSKLDDLYETMERDSDLESGGGGNTATSRRKKAIKDLFLKLYPFFHLIWSVVFWFYRFLFIFNLTDYNSPLLHILSMKLVYNTDTDAPSERNVFVEKFSFYLNRVFTGILFFIQFFNWYENISDEENTIMNEQFNKSDLNINYLSQLQKSSSIGDSSSSSSVDLVEPPPKLSQTVLTRLHAGLKNKSDFNVICPICGTIRSNDCALSTSGLVFCYPCIFKHVSKHKCCPVTGIPSNLSNLVRVYSNNT